jgi:hypothetical protein
MMKTRRLLDHPMFRQGLAMVLAIQPDMNLVAAKNERPGSDGCDPQRICESDIISLHTERRA